MHLIPSSWLENGMKLAEDIKSGSTVILRKGSKIDSIAIKQLQAYHIVAVNIMDPEDFETTFYGKTRVSKAFKKFEQDYTANLMAYKVAVDSFIFKKVPFRLDDLIAIVNNLVPDDMSGKTLFAYLYLHLPTEDELTYAHGLNVALICKIVAQWLNFSKEDTRDLCLCGFLYDIGKFNIPNEIIWKPEKLNKMEYDLMKTHAFFGWHLLSHYSKNVSERVLNATLQHHERSDGSGYPQGLNQNEIDQFAKIMAVLDVYEAMTSARPYRTSKCPYEVIQILEDTGLQLYDVSFIMTFLNHIVDELIGNRVKLSDDTEGEVIMNNPQNLARPMLKTDENNVINLAQRKDLKIIAII